MQSRGLGEDDRCSKNMSGSIPPTGDGTAVKKNRNKLNLTLNLNESNLDHNITTFSKRHVPTFSHGHINAAVSSHEMDRANLQLLYGSQKDGSRGKIVYQDSEYYDV